MHNKHPRCMFAVLGITAALLSALGACDEKEKAPAAGKGEPPKAATGGQAKVVSGTAVQLAAEFRKDEQATRDKYDDVEVEVSGPVLRIFAKEPAGAYGTAVILGAGQDVV
jgi:hypothetical protein